MMDKKNILSFLLGVGITIIFIIIFQPFGNTQRIENDKDVMGLYGQLRELEIVNSVSEDIDEVWQEISTASQWTPDGNVNPEDVLEGRTFYSNSREKQTGTLSFDGDATPIDVKYGKYFYSDSGELLTGEWKFEGNVLPSQVFLGRTFYSDSGDLLTGTYMPESISYLGDAKDTDVLKGKTFYSHSGELLTGTYEPPEFAFLGTASVSDVLNGETFYSNSGTLRTGTYNPHLFLGTASIENVLLGETFYSDSGTLKTGTYEPHEFLGTASIENVLLGETFYSDSGNLKTGTYEPHEFLGTATIGEVLLGATFYSDSGTLMTGTYEPEVLPNYEAQSLQDKDFRVSSATESWSVWTQTNNSPEVWYDERTDLYWSNNQGIMSNNFSIGLCDFFTTNPRGNYDGGDSDCGIAINTCATLSLDANGDTIADTNWYLPTQAELMQAYLNGIYLSTNTSWVSTSRVYSSTEDPNNSSYAWFSLLHAGSVGGQTKTVENSVHCVLRDL